MTTRQWYVTPNAQRIDWNTAVVNGTTTQEIHLITDPGDQGGPTFTALWARTGTPLTPAVVAAAQTAASVDPIPTPRRGTPTTAAATPTPAAETGDAVQHIAVPAYVYPTWYAADQTTAAWARLQAAAPTVGLTVINPNTGPGTTTNTDYARQIELAHAAGLTLLGYVPTGYGDRTARPLTAIKADIDRWGTLYKHIDGIFFDEAAADTAGLPDHLAMHAHVKASQLGQRIVVANPGIAAVEGYMGACDVLLNFEDTLTAYRTFPRFGYETSYPAHRFWHLVHGVTSTAGLDEALTLSRKYRAGHVYVTNDTGANPWDTVASEPYWTRQVEAVMGHKVTPWLP